MRSVGGVHRKHLLVAAVVAGAAGLALVAAGWWLRGWQHQTGWERLGDGRWWAGGTAQVLAHLAFGKVGSRWRWAW